jgi:phosphatidylserine/phosphatidylglycerophosphate/cardiolipin synthase-like enzyme
MSLPLDVKADLKGHSFGGIHTSMNSTLENGVTSGNCEVVFRNHEAKILQLINSHTHGFIFCAVAWFSNFKILDALEVAKTRGVVVAVVVQKEDFLRPDTSGDNNSWKNILQRKYDALGTLGCNYLGEPCLFNDVLRCAQHHMVHADGCPSGFTCDSSEGQLFGAVRCVGNYNREKLPSSPRMHNKFFIMGHFAYGEEDEDRFFPIITPTTVWTGSYNFSIAAEKSFENAVILRDNDIAMAYLAEFSLLFMLSEPLDWTHDWISPGFEYCT